MPIATALFQYQLPLTATRVVRVVTNLGTTDLSVPYVGTTAYFMLGDSTSADALQVLETAIDTVSGVDSCTITLTGTVAARRVNVVYTSGTITTLDLQWGHANSTLDGTIFGFSGNTGNFGPGGGGFTSPNMPMGWLPLGRPVSVDSRPRQRRRGGGRKALSGLTRRSNFGLARDERQLSASLLLQTLALDEYAAATSPYATVESMMVRSLSLGYAVRYVPDDTAVGTYTTWYLDPDGAGNDANFGLERMDDISILRWQWAADFVEA